jgi:4-amino-4-deoxy-L-arabinose transferase-like glycosyltransferase
VRTQELAPEVVEATTPPERTGPLDWWRGLSSERRYRLVMALIMAVGLAIRVAFVVMRQWDLKLAGDAGFYAKQAELVAQGKGFLNPLAYYGKHQVLEAADHPPGFVVFLVGLYKLGIQDPSWQRIVMCFMGTASLPVIGAVGRRLGGMSVGLVAAAIAAVYPNIWINDGMLMVETPFILTISLALLFTYRLIERRSWWDVVWLSLSLTLAASVRPEAAALFPFFVAPFLVFRRNAGPWKVRLGSLAIAAVIPVVVFAPWIAYNLGRFEQPVYLSTGFGQTLANANCDKTYSGQFIGYYKTECIYILVGGEDKYAPYEKMDGSIRDAKLGSLATAYIKEHKSELPKVIAARVGRLWGVYRADQSVLFDGWIEGRTGGPPGTSFRLVREALWMYYALVPLAIGGIVLLRRRRTAAIYPLLVQPLTATLAAILNSGITRYRAGAEVTIVLGAAVALVALWRWMAGPRSAAVPPDVATAREAT